MFLDQYLRGLQVKEAVMKKRKAQTFKQYTKSFVTTITVCAIVWITWSYVLATIQFFTSGMTQTLESLSTNVCTVIIGTALGYMIKSFIETYCEKKTEFDSLRHEDAVNMLRDVNMNITPDEIVGMYKKI